MDAQGPGSPYQQTLQQEPWTNAATPTLCTIRTSFHLSSRTIATPPPTTHPSLSYACMHVHTYTYAASSPLHFLWYPTLSTSSTAAIPSSHRTHTFMWTHMLAHMLISTASLHVSMQPRAGSHQEWGSIMSVG